MHGRISMKHPRALLCRLRSVVLWTCAIALASPRALPQDLSHLGHQDWSTENGLPQNSVHQIFQSRDGYIWISTEGGVARFNGLDFKVFNQENTTAFTTDDICCFAQDARGALWIGTADGLLKYEEGRFIHFTTAGGPSSNTIKSLATGSDGHLYLLSSDGITAFDGKTFIPLPLPSSVVPTAMTVAEDGSLWIASTSQIFQYRQGTLGAVALPAGLPAEAIEGIGTLPSHTLWIRTRSKVTLLQDTRQHTLQVKATFPSAQIQSFLQDSRGDLWIGTGDGLFLVDGATHRTQRQPSLGSNSILSLFEDREGNLWVGTETAGLHILRQQNFYTVPALSDHVTTAITQSSDGAMWVGTNGDGLDRWKSGKVQHFSTLNGLLSEIILALAPGVDGSVWAGTPDGLNRIAGTKVEAYTSADGLPDDFIRSLLLDSDGSLWIGTRRGLAHWKNKTFTTYTQDDGLRSNLIGALVESHPSKAPQNTSPSDQADRLDLWIGTLDGLARLHDGKITTYTTKDGLSGNVITSLLEDSHNTLWVGTKGNGLSRSSPNGFVSARLRDLPRAVDSILEDDHDNLWLSSTHGITRVARSALIACGSSPDCSPHPESYGRSDGMPTEEASAIGHPAAWKDTEGLLWFATRKGVAITNPNHQSEARVLPPVVIERFTVDDAEPAPSGTELSVAPGHTRFAFEYAGLSYTAPSRVRYRYILEGFDKQWTEAGSRRIAYYTNLPPRHYRFRVQAANSGGPWNEADAELAFYVRPPFYRKPWFLLLALALIATVVVLLYRLRLRRLRSQFDAVLAERNRMAREIHDTLAQSFVGVSVQLELTAQLLAQSQLSAAHEQIDRTRSYVREGLAEARRSIWDLRAITATDTLPTRLTRLVEQTHTEQIHTNLTIGGTYRALAPALESEVLRIAQEALTNVTRHSQATSVDVDLRYHSKRLTLAIADNGRGFRASGGALPEQGHFGLQGMRERAAQIGAQLSVESSPEQGTRITLDTPIVVGKGTKKHG
jgi:signal transduction histidine kinase/ligand-binding sensor domain-containing protein